MKQARLELKNLIRQGRSSQIELTKQTLVRLEAESLCIEMPRKCRGKRPEKKRLNIR